jgi:hypothetical protein
MNQTEGLMFYVGLDLGKKVDFTAVAVVERVEQPVAWMPPTYLGLRVRHLERMALGTPYLEVAKRVREVVRHPKLGGRVHLTVDATGVGGPVVEMLRGACGMTAVTITGGEKAHGVGDGQWCVPKVDLMTGIQLLLERRELKIAKAMKEAGTLVKELLDMRLAIGGRMGAEGAGQHDDLVMAVALACWQAGRVGAREGIAGIRRLPGI